MAPIHTSAPYQIPDATRTGKATTDKALLGHTGKNRDHGPEAREESGKEDGREPPPVVEPPHPPELSRVEEMSAEPDLEEGTAEPVSGPVHQEGRAGVGQPGDKKDGPCVGPAARRQEGPQENEGVGGNGRKEILQRRPQPREAGRGRRVPGPRERKGWRSRHLRAPFVTTSATAWTAKPLASTDPPHALVALSLYGNRPPGIPRASARRRDMAAEIGADLGALGDDHHIDVGGHEARSSRRIATDRRRRSMESAPLHSSSPGGKWRPTSPAETAPRRASMTAWATASPSE